MNWTNPGPGGFYDDLGNLTRQPHLVRGLDYAKDPAFSQSPLVGFSYRPALRSSWWNHAEALYDAPLKMHYDDLDPTAQYKIRVVYAGDSPNAQDPSGGEWLDRNSSSDGEARAGRADRIRYP